MRLEDLLPYLVAGALRIHNKAVKVEDQRSDQSYLHEGDPGKLPYEAQELVDGEHP